jgi:hypothetical protein
LADRRRDRETVARRQRVCERQQLADEEAETAARAVE